MRSPWEALQPSPNLTFNETIDGGTGSGTL